MVPMITHVRFGFANFIELRMCAHEAGKATAAITTMSHLVEYSLALLLVPFYSAKSAD